MTPYLLDQAMTKKKRGQEPSNSEEEDVEETEQAADDDNHDEEEADLSLCDASFRAEDAVPTSGHELVSRCTETKEHFLTAVQTHFNKNRDFDWEESLGTLTEDELGALWSSLHQYLSLTSPEQEQYQDVVAGVIMIAKFSVHLETINTDFIPPGLQSTVLILHNMLPSTEDTKISNAVCHILETWYINNLPDRDALVYNVLIYLLRKSLGSQAAKTDVRRVWSLHPALLEHSLTQAETLLQLVVATVASNLYLTTAEGVRWLVFLFSLSPDLVIRLHKQVRAGLVKISKPGCLGLGE